MPASPSLAETLTRPVSDLFEQAEYDLLAHLARTIGQDIDSPRWADRRIRAVGDLRSAIDTTSAALRRDATSAVDAALIEAYQRGWRAGVGDLGHLNEAGRRALHGVPLTEDAPRQLGAAVERDLRPLYRRITTSVTDAYRRITTRAAASVNARRSVAQQALNAFAGHGITGLIDPHGRGWSMTAYAAMATRAATGRAVVDGHTDLLQGLGLGLVVISNSPLECPLCRPWESKVLTLDEAPGRRVVLARSAIGSQVTTPVRVAGSLTEARAAGLFHVNCTHNVSAYLPGLTRTPAPSVEPRNADYEDTQQQRYLERQLRGWRRRQAVGLDDRARRESAASARAYELRLADLTARTGLRRQRARERVTL